MKNANRASAMDGALTIPDIDLGFNKSRAQTRVVVAMSGGVDSSVCAALVHAAGYEVIGITLQLYDHGAAIAKKNACCAGQDIHDAKYIAELLGFPHYTLDYETRFGQSVMEDFADTYMQGATPIPCVRCNQSVKFTDLLELARGLVPIAWLRAIMSRVWAVKQTPKCISRKTKAETNLIFCSPQPKNNSIFYGFL